MSVLGREDILSYLKRAKISERLIITPILDLSQVGASSVDVRLGNEFIITRRGGLPSIDPAKEASIYHEYQTKRHVNFKEKFYLHPNELILASTLEYVRLPRDLTAYVTSRSSWGRVGLVIATAVAIAPGFTGCITLELVNLGEVPLVLYPGARIAQVVIEECKGGSQYTGKYSCYTGPQYANVFEDHDMRYFSAGGGDKSLDN